MLSKQQLDKLNKAELVSYALNLSDLHEKFEALEKSFSESVVAIEKNFRDQLEAYKERTDTIIEDLSSQLEIAKNKAEVRARTAPVNRAQN